MSRARNNGRKLDDIRNVREFGAVLDGVTNDLTAFNLAVLDIPVGTSGRIVVDGVAYLGGAVTSGSSTRTPIFVFRPGAGICATPGGPIGFESNSLSWPVKYTMEVNRGPKHDYSVVAPDTTTTAAVRHKYTKITGNPATLGHEPGVGDRTDYFSWAYGINPRNNSIFDIADFRNCVWDRTAQGQDIGNFFAQNIYCVSPKLAGADTRWSMMVAEWDVANRGRDSGFAQTRQQLLNWVIGFQTAVTVSNLGFGGDCYNCLAAYVICHSSSEKKDGLPGQQWIGILGEANAICGDGFGNYWNGNISGYAFRDPKSPYRATQSWRYGFDTRTANLTSGRALQMGKTQRIAWIAGDTGRLEFAAELVGALTPTLAAPFTGRTGPYELVFSNNSVRSTLLTNGSTAVTSFGTPVTANKYASYSPSIAAALEFTAPLVNATSGTVIVAFTDVTGKYSVKFADGSVRQVNCVNGSNALTWVEPYTTVEVATMVQYQFTKIVFTAALVAAVSGTLKTPWLGFTGVHSAVFSDGSTQDITLTENSTAATWAIPVTTKEQVTYDQPRELASIEITPSGYFVLTPVPPAFADDAAAAAGGVPVGGIYRIGSAMQIRVA